MEFLVGEKPAKGLRVWTQVGLKGHGLNKTDILPETGGTIVFQDDEGITYGVQWDTGKITVHPAFDFAKELVCIGPHRTLVDYWLQEEIENKRDLIQ